MRISVLVFLVLAAAAAAQPYHYEPELTTLTGTLKNDKVFYGPPGYGQDPKHDEKEVPERLVLEVPIAIEPVKGDRFNQAVKDVKELTIVHGKVKDVRPFLDQRVKAIGKLFEAHTGHHHTPALIDLESLELAPKSK